MYTYEARLATVEKDVALMKQDIIYKLDENNSAITILKGVVGDQGQDIKFALSEIQDIKVRLGGMDQRLDGIDRRLDGMDQRFVSLEEKFDKRFEQVDKRFDQVDKRFDQVLQVLATLTHKAE